MNKDNPQQSLFGEEDFQMEQTSQAKSGPVTVLGQTFANDDERREYFRAELRRRLPELRKIEGFPIGEDDDIIALSDPPYYTACPNPWLNDFIAEWEKEKKQLEVEGKRSADFEVKAPYASDVSEGKNNPVYVAHTYHTKVPHPAIMRYILHYTQPGDVVFDGFCGTGMTGVAANLCGNAEEVRALGETDAQVGVRHAICGDLSPYATMIAYNYNNSPQTKLFKTEAERIFKELDEEYGWMYETIETDGRKGKLNCMVWSEVICCQNCGHEFTYWNAAIDHVQKKLLDNFACPKCGCIHTKKTAERVFHTVWDDALQQSVKIIKHVPVLTVTTVQNKRIERPVNDNDITLIEKIAQTPITNWIPTGELPVGYNTEQPKTSVGYYHFHQFYSRRNLIYLAALNVKINNSVISNKLRFILTAIVSNVTMMNRMQVNYYFNGGGGWVHGQLTGTLFIPKYPIEINVLNNAENKVNSYIRASTILEGIKGNALQISSATQTSINKDSVDYIFTDPPFGANINYSELNSLPEAWLNLITNNLTEAIENPAQGKNAAFYHSEMQRCFAEYYRILKPGHWMTVEFSNTKAVIWNYIQNSISSVGFIIVNVAALDKKQGTYKAQTTTTAVKQDLVITCYKPTAALTEKISTSLDKTENVWDFVSELLEHLPVHLQKDNKTTAVVERSPKILFDRMIAYYVQHGYPVPMDSQEFQMGLRDRFVHRDGMYFTAEQAIEYDEKKRLAPEMQTLALFVDCEQSGISWIKNELHERGSQTYADLSPKWMQSIQKGKKGDKLPELRDILEENFIEEEGYWRLPDPEKEADLDKMRTKKLLREFKTYVEIASKPKGKIKEARLEALRTGFKQCYKDKDFATIVKVGNRIDQDLLMEDEQLLQYYQIATRRI